MKPVETCLAEIGEHDTEIISAVLETCRTDLDARRYFVSRAMKTDPRPIETDSTIDQLPGETEMSLTISETASSNYEPCPAGTYLAICCRVIDLGTQTTDYQGETKHQAKVLITFEIADEETRREDKTPFLISKRYTASLHEKSALRKDLASWRGRDFTPEELAGFNVSNLMGKTAYISVVHAAKDDRTFANVSAIMKPPKGALVPEGCGQEENLLWDMAKPDWTVFPKLSKRVIEQIDASPEFKALKPPASVQLGQAPQDDGPPLSAYAGHEDDVAF